MTTAAARAMKDVIAGARPALRERGYRRRSNSFNRTVEPDGIIHVVNFQMGAFHPPGTVEIPALRSNLYGRFTINLGVWLPGIAETGFDQPPEAARAFVNDYHCQIRARIGELLPERTDMWWRLDLPGHQLTDIVTTALTDYGFPWLARFTAWDAVVAQLEAAPADPNWFMSPPRLTAMKMRLARGQRPQAERDFAEHMDACRRNPRNPGHLQVLTRIARANSFAVEVPTATPSSQD